MELFSEITATHTGNSSDKWQHYLNVYDGLLAPFQHQAVSVLEVGVCNGGSLEIWERYFLDAQHIVGCDINPKCQEIAFNGSKIDLVIGDIKDIDTVNHITQICPEFDIIIDDGSHHSSDIIAAFVRLFPLLKAGGVYVIEDLCCSYWFGWEGGIDRANSAMQFLKQLADVVNFEHWDVNAPREALFSGFAAAQGIENVDLDGIHSMTFSNSMCVIHKKAATENTLGARVVAGKTAKLLPNVKHSHGMQISDLIVVSKQDRPLLSDVALAVHQQDAWLQQQHVHITQQQTHLEQQQTYIEQLLQYIQQLEQHVQVQQAG